MPGRHGFGCAVTICTNAIPRETYGGYLSESAVVCFNHIHMAMVDIHSHILPNVDDGSNSWETTEAMCRIAFEDGIRHMVATPHANFDYYYDRDGHQALLEELRARMPEMQFSLGCDFHLSYDNIEDALKHPRKYTIGHTRYLLVEFSDYGISRQMPEVLYSLHLAGMRTIITHPERNVVMQRDPEIVKSMAEMGCIIQITANSLTGFWGKVPRKLCESFLKQGIVGVIASDAHSTKRRVPVLSEACAAAAKIVGEEKARAMVERIPLAIVKDEPLD